ncbi:hypothetical protein LWT90_22780, partial [Enterobacter hormaechei]|nr:hypothetical protein [Enterobacter hormaechei]
MNVPNTPLGVREATTTGPSSHRRKTFARILAALAAPFCIAPSAFAQDAASILEKADTIRFPREPFQVEVSVTSTTSSGE